MFGPDLCRPRQQTSLKIFGLLNLFLFVWFCLCSWVRVVAHSRDLRKNKKIKETTQLNHVWAKPVPAEAADLVQNLLLFLPLFLSPCGGTLTRSEGEKKKRNIEAISGPDLCRPRQQTFFKIVGLFCVVVFVLFFFVFPFVPEPVWWHTHDIWRKIKNQTKQKQQPS